MSRKQKPKPERVAVAHISYVLASTAVAVDALEGAMRIIDADHGCPDGTTCPVCLPLRRALRDVREVHEYVGARLDEAVR